MEVAIIALPWGNLHGDGVHAGIDVCVSFVWHRPAPNTLPSGARPAAIPVQPADRAGGQARRLRRGHRAGTQRPASEGAGENLFPGADPRRISTPPVAAGILTGITSDSVLVLASGLGVDVVEGDLPRELLYTAEEVFLTGTASRITPVRSVDRKPVGKATRARSRARCRMRSSACSMAVTPTVMAG